MSVYSLGVKKLELSAQAKPKRSSLYRLTTLSWCKASIDTKSERVSTISYFSQLASEDIVSALRNKREHENFECTYS